ncbi:MAG TPA: hypothetical protein VH593_13420 [Ktedonobacteraceae bacterium]|jgi:hypothetical protein
MQDRYMPLPIDSPQMRQIVFALQCRIAVVAHEMLRDYTEGGYKKVGDNAKTHMMDMIGFQPSLSAAIWYDMFPLLRGARIPWDEVMSMDWSENDPKDDGNY